MGSSTAVQTRRRLFTVEEYYEMARAGILTEDDRVELIEGEIVRMSPIGSRHAACVKRTAQLLRDRLGSAFVISVQDPIRLGDRSEPEPDVALLRPEPTFYAKAHPGPRDVLLVIEVAESSVEFDRDTKLLLYARAGIRESWLVDLADEKIEIRRQPGSKGYRKVAKVKRGDSLTSLASTGVTFRAEEILG